MIKDNLNEGIADSPQGDSVREPLVKCFTAPARGFSMPENRR